MYQGNYNGLAYVQNNLCASFLLSDPVRQAFPNRNEVPEFVVIPVGDLEKIIDGEGFLSLPSIGIMMDENMLRQIFHVAHERQRTLGGQKTVPAIDSQKAIWITVS